MKALLLLLTATVAVSSVIASSSARAEMDSASQEGAEKTKQLLTNPTERNKAIAKDPKAQEVDKKMKSLVGEGNGEQVYQIAADVFERIIQESKGDPEKLKAMLEAAQKDPQGFYSKSFSDQDKAKVRSIAVDVEKRKTAVPSNR
jgi:hypothetical protein